MRLGFPIAENLWLTNSYTLSNNEISDVQTTASRAIRRRPQGEYWTSAVGTSLSYDQRNNWQEPDQRLLPDHWRRVRRPRRRRAVHPRVGGGTLLLSHHREDHASSVAPSAATSKAGAAEDVRLLDLFYKGGETIRGFYMAGFGPRDTADRRRAWRQHVLVDDGGGALPVAAHSRRPRHERRGVRRRRVALRAGASAKKLNTQCGQALQIDPTTGAVLNPGVCLADSSSIRASIGVGILWNSPLGPLRLDIAKAILKEDYDKEQLIRFGASTRF